MLAPGGIRAKERGVIRSADDVTCDGDRDLTADWGISLVGIGCPVASGVSRVIGQRVTIVVDTVGTGRDRGGACRDDEPWEVDA